MHRVLKTIVSVTIGALLLWAVDWKKLPALLQHYQWWTVAASVICIAVQFPVSAWKWRAALQVCGAKLQFMFLLRGYCIGHFIGQFLPTTIGGDAYRAYRVLPLVSPRSRAVTSIVLERVVGFASLLVLGAIAAAFLADEALLARAYLLFFVVGAVCSAALLAAVQRGKLKFITNRVRHRSWFQAVDQDYRQICRLQSTWIPLVLLSFVFQATAIVIIGLLLIGAGANITISEAALITAITGIAGMLPITINGLGVSDGSIALTAVALGADYESAFVAALLLRILVLPFSLGCGLIYIFEPNAARLAETPLGAQRDEAQSSMSTVPLTRR
jgi:uncharacterized protein (TIRG00374 family)